MSISDRERILRRIAEVEDRISNLREQQEEAEATLRSLRDQLGRSDPESRVPHNNADEALAPASEH